MKYYIVIIIWSVSQVFSQDFDFDDYRNQYQGITAQQQQTTTTKQEGSDPTEKPSIGTSTTTTTTTSTGTTNMTTTTTTTTPTTNASTTEEEYYEEDYYYDEVYDELEDEGVKLSKQMQEQYEFLQNNKHLDEDIKDQVRT